MRIMSPDIGTLHFIGIGGIGMSGIAILLNALGYRVQGSDQAEGANVARLREMGIKVTIGHVAANIFLDEKGELPDGDFYCLRRRGYILRRQNR